MSDNADKYSQLLSGLENRFDIRNRRQFQIDVYNRGNNWEDFRSHHRSVLQYNHQDTPTHSYRHGDMMYQQHGSYELHGYNTNYPVQPAFQLLATHPVGNVLQQEMGNYSYRPSPVLSRTTGTIMGANAFQHRSSILDTSLTANTDELVMKIAGTFPTVSETHIRCLLKKYHNREAVVMSALQVEKYPIATPGPHSTPPLGRNMSIPSTCTPYQMTPPLSIRGTPSTSIRRNMVTPPVAMYGNIGTPPLGVWGTPPTRGSSPILRPGSISSYCSSPAFGECRQSPKSQSSPKMKLRYLKSVFPKVDETLLLDTLVNENNNVMKTTEKLKSMGYEKKEMGKSTKKTKDMADVVLAVKSVIQNEVELQKPTPPPRMKSLEEKNRMKARLAGLYDEIPERLIQIAIESVNYDEEKARHLLMLMINEEKENKLDSTDERNANEGSSDKDNKKDSTLKDLQKSNKDDDKKRVVCEKAKSKKDVPKVSRGTSTTEDKEYKSMYLTKANGRNRNLRKGPNDQLLLSDYMTWHGPNPELRCGPNKSLAEGPNKNLLSEKQSLAKGPKKENWKGPISSLAKGSIYSHLTMILKG